MISAGIRESDISLHKRKDENKMLRTTNCRACGERIAFIRCKSGKYMPVDACSVCYVKSPHGKQKFITPNGEVVSGDATDDQNMADGIGYISHFATCPQADKFRKQRKSDRKKAAE